jgi:hypothetical protein
MRRLAWPDEKCCWWCAWWPNIEVGVTEKGVPTIHGVVGWGWSLWRGSVDFAMPEAGHGNTVRVEICNFCCGAWGEVAGINGCWGVSGVAKKRVVG